MAHKGLDVFWELCVYVTAVLVETTLFFLSVPMHVFFVLFYLLWGKIKLSARTRRRVAEDTSLWATQRRRKSERWWARKQWKDTLKERKERDGSWQEKGTVCRFACIKSRRLRASSQYRHIHTQIYTQMHSDNPSALAKCCLIQPDLHSTEKANSLPLTVWKTERSSHKWQRSELPRLYVCVCLCVCVCACWHAHVHTLYSSCFYFWDDFFFSVSVRVFTCIGGDKLFSSTPFIVWQADS